MSRIQDLVDRGAVELLEDHELTAVLGGPLYRLKSGNIATEGALAQSLQRLDDCDCLGCRIKLTELEGE